MKLTTDHARSNYNIPIFVDNKNTPVDYPDGFRLLRKERGWSTTELGELAGVSRRTVEGWEQGRPPNTVALLRLMTSLNQ